MKYDDLEGGCGDKLCFFLLCLGRSKSFYVLTCTVMNSLCVAILYAIKGFDLALFFPGLCMGPAC